jgi:L-fucose isomerase-like protein
MSQHKVAIVTVASIFEQGVQEVEGWMDTAVRTLEHQDLKILGIKPVLLTDRLNVQEVVNRLRKESFDLLVVLNGTWTSEVLQIDLVRNVKKPVLLWALPIPRTYSLSSIIHAGSILKEMSIPFTYVYGAPDDETVARKIARLAVVARLATLWGTMRVGRIGKRYAWRTAGPFDVTYEELDLQQSGPTAVPIDIDEFLDSANQVTDDKANQLLATLKKNGKVGKVEVDQKLLLQAAKLYYASKELIQRYRLDALTVECYPMYPGLDNVASGWLAEEGIVLCCEGDVGHTAVWRIMQELSGKVVGLIEPTGDEDGALIMMHDGSGAPSLSEQITDVVLKPVSEERAKPSEMSGIVVNSSVGRGEVTMATIYGRSGKYKMSIVKGTALKLTNQEVEAKGGGLVGKIKLKIPVELFVERMINSGIDHHMMLTHGNIAEDLVEFCKMAGIEPLRPDN